MKKTTAAQQRLFDNAILIAATRLLFDAMREHFPCPRLGEIVTIHNGQGLPATARDAAGEYDVYAAGGLVGRHSAQLSDKPFVVVGRKGSAGKPTYAPFGGWVIDTAYYVQPNDDAQLDCKFLFYALSSLDFTNDIISTAIPGINRTSIYRYAIPLPPKNVQEVCVRFLDAAAARPLGEFPSLPPLFSEQQRIVARIEELAAKIEEARGLRLQAAAEAEAISTVVAATLFDNPEWPHRTIEELVGRANLKNGKSLKITSQLSEVRCLILSALRHGRINCSDTKPIPMTKAEAEPYLVHPGDVFVVRGNGSKELVGRAGVVEDDCEGVIFPDLFIRVPLDQDKVLGSFFVAAWNSRRIRDTIEESAKTTSGIWKINQGHIASTSIPVPPLHEQRHIVAYLDDLQAKVDALKHLQAETAAELDALLPSVLDKAFKGGL